MSARIAPRRRPVPNRTARLATESPNPATAAIDSLEIPEILAAIQEQDAAVPEAVRRELPAIAKAVEAVVRALRRGGRLIYVGAGTSGRIGVMDAAECPPTFGAPGEQVEAVIAGGARALTQAVEAAEDNAAQGKRDLAARRVGARDVVIGIAASGRTPYTIGALRHARSRGAVTVALTSNPGSPLTRAARIVIAPETGPEVIAGSTRMKAALAQKMVLHMISTAAMIRLGQVYGNYMVGVRPTNKKLWSRALTILGAIAGVDRRRAGKALRDAAGDVKLAIAMLKTGQDCEPAERLLRRHQGNLRAIC